MPSICSSCTSESRADPSPDHRSALACDAPPQVRFADGTERATVRARLDTLEEHEAAKAAAERAAAEARAEAAAAELLREEASKPARRPTSDNGKKKKR